MSATSSALARSSGVALAAACRCGGRFVVAEAQRSLDMRGEFDRLIAVRGEAVEELQQLLELGVRERSEQRVVNRPLKRGEPRQSLDAGRRHRELDATAIACMCGFFD